MNTKELIARAALELFVDKGVTETRIRDIAQAAGIAEGTMYRHYASKEDLAWELFSDNLAGFTEELEKLRHQHSTLKAQNEALIRRFCEFFDEDPILYSYLMVTWHAQHKKVTPDMPQPFNVVRDAVAEGMERGEIPKRNPVLLASMVSGLVRNAAVSKVSGRLEGSMTGVADEIVTASWRVLEG